MYVVTVVSECAPAAKAGGLGDAVSGPTHELELRGHGGSRSSCPVTDLARIPYLGRQPEPP